MGGDAMKVAGVCMVKDEEDIIAYTLPRMAAQLDYVIVADNMSEESTVLATTCNSLPNVVLINDEEPAYLQSQKMSNLALMAGEMGAEWIVPFDADEVWYHPHGIHYVLENLPSNPHVIQAGLYNHIVTGWDPEVPDVVERMQWRKVELNALPKVICRYLPGLVIEQGNHGAHYPGWGTTTEWSGIRIHHYPYRSVEQFVRKAVNGKAAYDAAGDRLPPTAGQHWREYGAHYERGGVEAIREIFTTWFYAEDPSQDPTLEFGPCPATL